MESNSRIEEDLVYAIALSQTEGVGSVLFKNLVNYFGGIREVFHTPASKLLKISGVGEQLVKALSNKEEMLRQADKIIHDSQKNEVKIVYLKSPDYPKALKNVFDPPPILYMKGKGKLMDQRTIAIVGSRDGSAYGKEVVSDLADQLKNVQVISGLAYGIDVAAHKAALKNELSTVAVLANGLDTVYPANHRKIAEEIMETGLLISEQPVYTKLHPTFFISRNRIIAALSEITLIVESRKKGGSMVTAEFANNYNKEVFAVPGNVNNKLSEGTNYLIFNNKANIYTDPPALIQWMNWDNSQKKEIEKPQLDFSRFSEEEAKILVLLSEKGEMLIDDLCWFSEINLNRLSSVLLNLEFNDVIKQVPGKKFMIR